MLQAFQYILSWRKVSHNEKKMKHSVIRYWIWCYFCEWLNRKSLLISHEVNQVLTCILRKYLIFLYCSVRCFSVCKTKIQTPLHKSDRFEINFVFISPKHTVLRVAVLGPPCVMHRQNFTSIDISSKLPFSTKLTRKIPNNVIF